MKTFEESFTAWVDGQLPPAEGAAFERELASHPEAFLEKESAQRVGRLLRSYPSAPELTNADFFSLQIAQRIEAELPKPIKKEHASGGLWSFSRLLWAGSAALFMAAGMFVWLIPSGTPGGALEGNPYFAQVVEAWPGDEGISASTVYTARDNVTVLWLDGLDYIPASYELK